ncbi:MAG: hypothetical protein WC423_15895 [Vulcanimicrobiota bacterium]
MRVVATGRYNGTDVEVTWHNDEEEFIDGPGDVVRALIDESASLTGTVMGDPMFYTIDSGYLEHYFGFKRVARRVLEDVSFIYPDGEIEPIPEMPTGFVA